MSARSPSSREPPPLSTSFVALVAVLVALAGIAPVAAVSVAPKPTAETGPAPMPAGPPNGSNVSNPKVADGLLSDRRTPAGRLASGADRIRVVIETDPGSTDGVARAVREYGTLEVHHDGLVQATVPRSAVRALADRPDVQFVRAPLRLSSLGGTTDLAAGSVTSEGVAAIGADRAHDAGYTGDGVTVAVVDVGFDPSSPEISDNVVRTKDFTGYGIGGIGSGHGTATAQVVVDTAPDVNLVLVSVSTYAEMVRAADWIRTQTDADVASMSLGLTGGVPLDGTARIDRAIGESVRAGTPWLVAAGNSGDGKHWNGTWRDGNGDGWLNFTDSDQRMAIGGPLQVTLQWSDWPNSSQNYDLYVVNESGAVLRTSKTIQNGNQPPLERLTYSESGTFYLKVKRVDAAGDATFDLFYRGYSVVQPKLEHWTEARSLTVPATAKRSTAVGAVNYWNLSLAAYSSQGPTVDGRRKPAFVAPTAVTTSIYDPFRGTSAAAPHAAGAVALLLDADPTLGPKTVVKRLENNADPRGWSSLPNSRVGSGVVDVDAAVRPRGPTKTRIRTDPITASNVENVTVEVRFASPPDGGSVYVRLQDWPGSTVVGRAPADTGNRTTAVTVNASSLADAKVTATAKLVDGLGNANVGGYVAKSDPVVKDTTETTTGDFRVVDLRVPAITTVNETTEVGAMVRNVGANATKAVTIRFDRDGDGLGPEDVVANRSISLDAGERTWVFGEVSVGAVAPGEYGFGVATGGDAASVTRTVRNATGLQVTGLEGPTTVPRGRRVTVDVTLRNVNDDRVSRATAFMVNGSPVGFRTVEIGGRNGTTLTFTAGTDDLSPGTYVYTVDSSDDVDMGHFTVGNATGGIDLTGNGRVSGSVDDDPVHEDVTGDGKFTIADVRALFSHLTAAKEHPDRYDVTGDGKVTIADVIGLFEKL